MVAETFYEFLDLNLVLTNLTFLIDVIYVWRLRSYPEITILVACMCSSSIYHLCQVGYYCFESSSRNFQIMDHFVVFSTVIWITLWITALRIELRFCIWFAFSIILLPFVIVGEGIMVISIVFLLMAVVFFGILIFVVKETQYWHIPNILILIILSATALTLFFAGGEIGSFSYTWTHDLWHVLAAIDVFFLIDIKYGCNWISKSYRALFKHDIVLITNINSTSFSVHFERLQKKIVPNVIQIETLPYTKEKLPLSYSPENSNFNFYQKKRSVETSGRYHGRYNT